MERIFRGWIFAAVLAAAVRADDWPQFLGPHRDGTSSGPAPAPWTGDGPRKLWVREVGAGFSGPVVQGTNGFLFHRQDGRELMECFDPASGAIRWQNGHATAYSDDFGFDEGPRGTPSIAEGRVYAMGAEGRLACWSVADGRRLWDVNAKERFGVAKGYFGTACSPLVAGRLVFVNLGGRSGAGVAAFRAASGELAWSATDDEAGYASPVEGPGGSGRGVLFFTRAGLRGFEPAAGKPLFSFPWRSRMAASVNAASPLVRGDEVFVTASYGTGAALLRLEGGELRTVWKGDDSLSAHYATPVRRDDFLYGFHGRQENRPDFRCVEWATGKVRWSAEGLGAGTAALVGDGLVLLLESGELLLVRASPERFEIRARAQILGTGLRAPFALAGGRIYARDPRRLAAFDLGRP